MHPHHLKATVIIILVVITVSCRPASYVQETNQTGADRYPESLERRATSENAMVSTAHPLATEAALQMLRDGGNAMDGVVAAAFVLSVVEPMMSGLGGSGSMTIWDAGQQQADYIDYYAQFGADPDYLLNAQFDENPRSVSNERMIATPGMVAGLFDAHQRQGMLSWKAVLEPAIRIAEEGFVIHRLLASVIRNYERDLTYYKDSADLFYPGGEPLQAGDRLVQTDLARVLKRIASEGASAFYEGEIPNKVLDIIQPRGSLLTAEDFANYEPHWRGALAGTYHDMVVFTAPPPLAGSEVLLALNMLEQYDMPAMGFPFESAEALSVLTDIYRLGMTDRWRWTSDPLFMETYVAGLISKDYAEYRSSEIGGGATDSIIPGDPRPFMDAYRPVEGINQFDALQAPLRPFDPVLDSPDQPLEIEEEQNTTHLVVVDFEGNAISMTNTLGLYFGSNVFIDGVFYNTANRNARRYIPNVRIPGRAAHSSTAPTIIVKDNQFKLALGSPGSGRIPPAVVSNILYITQYGLDPAASIRMPRFYPLSAEPVLYVEGGIQPEPIEHMRNRGFDIIPGGPLDMFFGGVHMVYRAEDGTLIGVADPRRDGHAEGI